MSSFYDVLDATSLHGALTTIRTWRTVPMIRRLSLAASARALAWWQLVEGVVIKLTLSSLLFFSFFVLFFGDAAPGDNGRAAVAGNRG